MTKPNFFNTDRIQKLMTTAVVLPILAGSFPVYNHLSYNDVSLNKDSSLFLRKTDGFFSHSEMEISYLHNFIKITKFDLFGEAKSYSDNNKDGKIESVCITIPFYQNSGIKGTFNTLLHLSTHPEVFERENQNYQVELKEFLRLYHSQYETEFKRLGLEKFME